MKRSPVNKHKSAKAFNHNAKTTKAANINSAPMRGGIRL